MDPLLIIFIACIAIALFVGMRGIFRALTLSRQLDAQRERDESRRRQAVEKYLAKEDSSQGTKQ
ncbi:hypothetical protein [Cupriavidus necator]